MKNLLLLLPLLFLPNFASADALPLFDGKTLAGWKVPPGDEKWWRVQDGAITGGSLTEKLDHNSFLSSVASHADFDLRFKVRLIKGEGFINSGVQVRSALAEGGAMSGYQVDAGIGYWGDLYDEHRRNRKIAGAADPAALKAVVKDWEWNEMRILCVGARIRSWINGVATLDFTETEPHIPLHGLLGLQAHSGGKFLVQFKDITLESLAAPAPAPAPPPAPKGDGAQDERAPATQLASFRLPAGYEIELVASEAQGVGKPITVSWDHAGRMWTMTAFEYPVDANEDAAAAEALYARGGKDKVLVFDQPSGPGPQTPRVFAEGLVMPLGMMPLRRGALVLYGHEIRYYQDSGQDGKADDYQAVLAGFGVQDSHLFPHQFERSPGGWFYLAQGLFNKSLVVRPGGQPFADGTIQKPFNQCKLARAKFDGSAFELLTAGPNNIWGFATARDGREFLQEANDLGHPVSEFIAGTHYPTGSPEKLRPYAPRLPPSTPGQPMGGTGLSGIALADDVGSPFSAKWPEEKVFYIVNPITNRIQIVTRKLDGNGHPVTTKREDFLTTTDSWFRPVAAHFGPDGCLYVVDWYNKIIAHNEVPRSHPDRDKTRGRIWRIKPIGMTPTAMPDLTALPSRALVDLLGHPITRLGRLAWQELGDRKDPAVLPELRKVLLDAAQPVAKRLGALWALQDMAMLPPTLLAQLAHDAIGDIRREALDAAGDLPLGEAEFLALTRGAEETDFQVRCALANALRRQPHATPAMIARVAVMGEAAAADNGRAAYQTNFIRYLLRWAFETHPAATKEMIENNSFPLPAEASLLALLALPPELAAPALLQAMPSLQRPLGPEEVGLLGSQLSRPEVARTFAMLLADPAKREGMLRALLRVDPLLANHDGLRDAVGTAAAAMLPANPASLPLVLQLARHFRLQSLAPLLAEKTRSAPTPADLTALLRTLNEIQAADPAVCASLLDDPDPAVAREALAGFAAAGGPPAVELIAQRWDAMPGVLREFAMDGILSNKPSAEAFARRAATGAFNGYDPAVAEKLAGVLGADHADLRALLAKAPAAPTTPTTQADEAQAARFEHFRGLIRSPGDLAAGRDLFKATCMVCHQVGGEGSAIGPDLSGAGALGVESLLRNILTPSAQLESGYYRHDVTLKDGSFVSGFLVSENPSALVLRQIGADQRVIPRAYILRHHVSKRSIMPEGLIDGFSPKQVADLFTYLQSLK